MENFKVTYLEHSIFHDTERKTEAVSKTGQKGG